MPNPLELRTRVTYLKEPSLGHVVIGGTSNPFIHAAVRTLSLFSHKSLALEATIEQALRTLQRKDPTLPNVLEAYQRLSESDGR